MNHYLKKCEVRVKLPIPYYNHIERIVQNSNPNDCNKKSTRTSQSFHICHVLLMITAIRREATEKLH